MKLKIIAIGLSLSHNLVYAAELHDNVLSFQGGSLQSFTPQNSPYNDKTYNITSGQPWGGVVQENDGQLHVLAGRHLSKDNVNWVKNSMNDIRGYNTPYGISWSKYNMYVTNGIADTPDSLNFVIYGDMEFKINQVVYICPKVYIGQGSSNISFNTIENWWVFSNNNYNVENAKVHKVVYIYCYLKTSTTENALLKITQVSPNSYPDIFVINVVEKVD